MDRRAFVGSMMLSAFAARQKSVSRAQLRLDEGMAQRQGSALVLDVVSGRIVAQHRLDAAAKRLVPPGSVIKPFVLAALIDSKVITPSSRFKCGRVLRINGRRLDCSHVDLGEPLDAVAALAYSCNCFFAEFAVRLEPQDLVRTLTSFGLTSTTAIGPSEVAGRITHPNDTGQKQLLALGEDGIQVTVPAVGNAFRRLSLMKRDRDARADQFKLLFDGLSAAAQYGTARLARPQSVAVAGKTGTANEQTGRRSHAWFAGFAPDDGPEICVVVFLETGSGGGDAAPIARQVFEAV